MATKFKLDVSPQMPCSPGLRLASSSYTPELELKEGSLTLQAGQPVTNLNLGLAVESNNASKVPYMKISLSPEAQLIAVGLSWQPVPTNKAYSYAFASFQVFNSAGQKSSYVPITNQTIQFQQSPPVYLLVHTTSDADTTSQPMHMVGGYVAQTLVSNKPDSSYMMMHGGIGGSGELPAVSATIPSTGETSSSIPITYLSVWVNETYLENVSDYSVFMEINKNGTKVPPTSLSIQRIGPQLFMQAPSSTPIFEVAANDKIVITSTHPNFPVYLPSTTSPNGALVLKGGLSGRVDGAAYTSTEANGIFDGASPFCDFFTGNPLLRSKTPASGCQNPSTCVTFLNPNVPETAHIAPNALFGDDSVFFFEEGTHRRPVMHPIRMPLPHASMTDLLGAEGCSFANFNYSTAATCKTVADCKAEGGGDSMGCCLANPGGTSSGYCYDMDEYFCAYDPTASKPSLKPLQHYYRRTPYSSSTSAHPLSFSNDASASADYHCDPSKSFDDCCSGAIDSVMERTCGYKNAPMCPLGTEVTQIGTCQNHGPVPGGPSTSYLGAVNFTCSNPAHCTVDSDCAGVTKCVAGQCACTANSCGSGYACIGVTCQPLVTGYSYFRGSLARDPPVNYGDVLPNVENCFAGTPTFTPSKDWSVNVALQPSSIPIPTIPGTDGGKITWQGMLAIDNGVPISKGSYYFSKDMAGSPSPGDRLGPTLVPFYKQCLGTDCEADRIRGVWLGGMCCGSALPPGSCNPEGVCIPTNGCVSSSQAGNYYFVG